MSSAQAALIPFSLSASTPDPRYRGGPNAETPSGQCVTSEALAMTPGLPRGLL